MTRPFDPVRAEPVQAREPDLRALQSEWDTEGAAIEAARPPLGPPALLAAWRDLWRETPAQARRDLIVLAAWTPALLLLFALWWRGLPS